MKGEGSGVEREREGACAAGEKSQEKRTYDVSCGENRYVTLPLAKQKYVIIKKTQD